MDYHICGGAVGGNRNVVNVCYTKQRLDVGIVGLRLEGIPEKYYHIDLSLGYLCTDLLVSAKRAREVALYGKLGCLGDKLCSRSRAAEIKLLECSCWTDCRFWSRSQ